MQEWYNKESWDDNYNFATALETGRRRDPDAEDMLAKVAGDRKLPGIVRATAIRQRGLLLEVRSFSAEVAALKDQDPQVRAAAVSRFYDRIPNVGSGVLSRREEERMRDIVAPIVRYLVPLLDDPRRVVRGEVGRVLARLPARMAGALLNGAQREKLDQAIVEYIAGINESNDRGGAHMELGVLYETLGRDRQAEDAYRTAIRIEPLLTGPRSNLAALLERSAERLIIRSATSETPEPALRGQQEAKQLRREELDLMARDARLLPESAAIQYRYGLSLYLNGEEEKAEQALRAAWRLEPDNDQFLYALVLFFDKFNRFDEAMDGVDQLLKLRPNEPQYLRLREMIQEKIRAPGTNNE
jgi:Flp pilus assembly protein TadD